jgi:hypothetical protein
LGTLAALLALTVAAAEPVHIGIIEFKGTAELMPLSTALSGLVANELQRMGAFKVTSSSQVSTLISHDRQRQLLGCNDDECASEATIDLGFNFLVTGTLTRYAGTDGKRGPLTLELLLLSAKSKARTGSEVVTGADEAQLMANISPAVARLVGKLLSERSGSLVVLSSETGSALKVDDVVVGTTPLEGKLQVAGGPHFVRLEKEGFVAWQKEIRISPDTLTEESVRLVPSPDFIAAYESKQRKLRAGAWVATGVAVAGVAAAIAFEARAAQLYGSKGQDGSFLGLREKVTAGDESARELLNQAQAQISSAQTLTGVFIGVAAAGGAAAVVLWLMGDDPNRYSAYREVGLKADAAIGPGGGFVSLTGAW